MAVTLESIDENELSILNNLVELAAYDLSELSGSDINENGLYVVNFDSRNWFEDANFHLYFIRFKGILVGFVVIRKLIEENVIFLNHFFILRKYRRQNIGREAAKKAFNLFTGKWRVSQFDWNIPAQIFWRKTIKEYLNDNPTEIRR
ncbi:GNAT family N-acetyltransferase [Paenibacillus kobensis]|uniref:GNAT family N-acetyltransferase n=1 Tax=Paenibacillus kobensis TaxID=59841 RepID=UPI0013E2E578|nr:GNAT family N-acetyltransferase [Paenibacillus kobensis]